MGCNKKYFRFDYKHFPDYLKKSPIFNDYKIHNDGIMLSSDEALEIFRDKFKGFNVDPYISRIGCGVCAGCRLERSRQWAVRLSLEAELYPHNYFLTLTYNDIYLPKGEYLEYDGSICEDTLVPRDVSLFLKRFRKRIIAPGLKVFWTGEYGDLYNRPHYHIILLNCPELNLEFLKRNGSFDYFSCEDVDLAWSENVGSNRVPLYRSMGFHAISEFTFDTAAYTSRYVMKKQLGKSMDMLRNYNGEFQKRVQPFCIMSRRNPIAKDVFMDHLFKIHEENIVLYRKKFDVFASKPPRYFDKLYDDVVGISDADKFARSVAQRSNSELVSNAYYSRFSETRRQRMDHQEDQITSKERDLAVF